MRRTIQDQIAANRRLSLFYCFLVVLLLCALGTAIGGYYAPEYWWVAGLASAGLGLVVALVGWFGGSKIVLSISNTRSATPLELRTLTNVTEEMAIAAGIRPPAVYLIDDSAPNAFATGRNPNEGVVVVTTGLMQKLTRDELQAVVAHEIGHIRNNDVRLMTMLALVAGLIPLIADAFGRSLWWGGGRSRRNNNDNGAALVFLAIAIVLMIVAPICSKLLELAVSRRREFLADATSAELTRNPDALVSALHKISGDQDVLEAANRATAHLYIVNPIKKFEERAAGMFSTHPPLEQRVRALEHLAGAFPRHSRELQDRLG